jgi:hypothetical protein
VSEQSATDAARDIIFADSKNRARGELIRTIIEAPDGADIVVIVQSAPGALISLGVSDPTAKAGSFWLRGQQHDQEAYASRHD